MATQAPTPKPKPATAPAAAAVASAGTAASKKAASFVTVGCKLPTGLILQLSKEVTYFEDTPGGARERKRFDRYGQRFVLRGTAMPAVAHPGMAPPPVMIGGYALTQSIPADFWEAWEHLHRDTAFILNHQVIAWPKLADLRADALEHKAVRSGFEPMTPDKDPRSPKPISTAMTGIETADEMKAALAASRIEQMDVQLEDA